MSVHVCCFGCEIRELTLPVTIAFDYTTRNLEKTARTEPIQDLLGPAPGTSDLVAFVTIQ